MLIFRVVWSEFKVNQQNPTGAEWICCLSFIQPAGTQTDRQKMRTEQLLSFTDNLKCILLLCRWQQGLHQQQVCFYFCKTRSDSKESGMNFVFFYDLSFFYVTVFMCSFACNKWLVSWEEHKLIPAGKSQQPNGLFWNQNVHCSNRNTSGLCGCTGKHTKFDFYILEPEASVCLSSWVDLWKQLYCRSNLPCRTTCR